MVLTEVVDDSNKDRAIFMKGLPFRVKLEEIIVFFEGYGKLTDDDIFLE